MKIIKDKKIFDMRNPNCTIKTPINEIAAMFDKIPIVDSSNTCIGIVIGVERFDEQDIYGEVILYKDFKIGDLINYEMEIDKFSNDNHVWIKGINSLTYELI